MRNLTVAYGFVLPNKHITKVYRDGVKILEVWGKYSLDELASKGWLDTYRGT